MRVILYGSSTEYAHRRKDCDVLVIEVPNKAARISYYEEKPDGGYYQGTGKITSSPASARVITTAQNDMLQPAVRTRSSTVTSASSP